MTHPNHLQDSGAAKRAADGNSYRYHATGLPAGGDRDAPTKPTADSFVVIGTAAEILDVLRGPRPAPQHDEHTKGYRWFQYLADSEKRMENVREEARKIIAARRAAEDAIELAQAAE